MSRRPKPTPKPADQAAVQPIIAAPKPEAVAGAPAPAAVQPATEAPKPEAVTVAPAPDAQTQKPESTLGDGDATGAAQEAPSATAAPQAPAPDVVKTPSAAVKGHVVRVVGPAKGRWRAGRHFTPEPVEIAASELTVEDMQKLFDDPELICAVVDEA